MDRVESNLLTYYDYALMKVHTKNILDVDYTIQPETRKIGLSYAEGSI